MTVQYQWHGPAWLEPWFDQSSPTIFHRVSSVEIRGRRVSEALLELQYVDEIVLNSCDISESLLEELNRRKSIASMSEINCRIDRR